jgi:hypothetical protein
VRGSAGTTEPLLCIRLKLMIPPLAHGSASSRGRSRSGGRSGGYASPGEVFCVCWSISVASAFLVGCQIRCTTTARQELVLQRIIYKELRRTAAPLGLGNLANRIVSS